MTRHRELFKNYFVVDYINCEFDIPGYIRKKIKDISIEYIDDYTIYITKDTHKECPVNYAEIYMNYIRYSIVEFNVNGILCRFTIVAYFTRLSKNVKKYVNQIDFTILFPLNEIYTTVKNDSVTFVNEFYEIIKEKIKAGLNSKMADEKFPTICSADMFKIYSTNLQNTPRNSAQSSVNNFITIQPSSVKHPKNRQLFIETQVCHEQMEKNNVDPTVVKVICPEVSCKNSSLAVCKNENVIHYLVKQSRYVIWGVPQLAINISNYIARIPVPSTFTYMFVVKNIKKAANAVHS